MPRTLIRRLSLLQTSCLMIALGLPSWQLASAHVRDQTILLTYISLAGGPQNAHIGVYIDFASVPLNHKVSNVEPSGMEIALTIENAAFRPYRYELVPGESTGTQNHINPSFVLPENNGVARASRDRWLTPASEPDESQVQRIR